MAARFALGRELGRGALGRVVELSSDDGRALAGKILHPSHRLDARARARFAAEAELLRGLNHPNLIEVVGLEPIDGEDVLVMERVDGDDLAAVIARAGALPAARVVAIGRGIAEGLAAAHRAGLIHRDLKPHNVLLAPGDVPKIGDFGMARTASFAGARAGEGAGAVVGTPDYLAPEAVDPLAVDARADLYALGCVLCEMATGRPPYAAPTAFALLEAHRAAPLPELAELAPGLRQLIRWLLAKAPADRPASAQVVARALAELTPADAGALVAIAPGALVPGRCSACGAALVVEVPVCFSCGVEQPRLEPGGFSVFVTGPGELAEKLSPVLRLRLADWLRANPALGLDPAPLAKRIPRLPFALATRVSEASGDVLVAALATLGLEASVARGGRFALGAMRAKAVQLGKRVALIAVSSGFIFGGVERLAILAAITPFAAIGGGAYAAGQLAARRRPARRRLAGELAEPLDRVAGVLPAIGEARHRESLRAVVQRVVALAERPGHAPAIRAELARVIDLAVVATGRVDELERALADVDLRADDPEVRARLRDRDRWAARLLELAAFLDAFRAHAAAARARTDDDERLAELTRQVEALEELAAT